MKLPFERDLVETVASTQAAVACVAQGRKRDVDLLTRSRLRLAASRDLLRKPVGTLIVAREAGLGRVIRHYV